MHEREQAIEVASWIINEYDGRMNKKTAKLRHVSSPEFDLIFKGVHKKWISERFQIRNNALVLDDSLTIEAIR